MSKMTPEAFLDAALKHVESASIRAWATTDHNKPIVLKMAANSVEKNTNPQYFATYLVCCAMGL